MARIKYYNQETGQWEYADIAGSGGGSGTIPTKVSELENDAGYLTEHQDISGKLDASALPTAINTALAQAKASGEFDGQPGKDGSNGKDGTSVTHSWNGTTLTVTSASGTSSANLKGDKGDKGDSIKGDPGSPGTDGVSPTVAVSKSGKVTTISITDKNGTKTATINDGADGSAGSAGKDGTSVTVKSVSESTADGGSNVVTFSDGKTVTIKNGSKGSTGAAGKDGKDGVGVTVTSSKSGKVTTLTITDAEGTKTVPIKDGEDGLPGTSATHSWNGTVLTITSKSGTSSADLKGEKGDPYVLTDTDKSVIAEIAVNMMTPMLDDYATERYVQDRIADAKPEIVSAVIAALPVYAGEVV